MRKNIALGGISRIPGGATSGDGDLSIAVNVANDGQGIQLLEKPEVLFTLDPNEELLCIHTPEGEEKHYITQIVVGTVQSVSGTQETQGLGGISASPQEPEPADESDIDTPAVPLEPIEPFDPEPEIVDPSEPVSQDPTNIRPTVDPYEPPVISVDVEAVYDEAVMKERFEREFDNGGTVINPPSGGGGVEPPIENGIYLVWRRDNGDGTSDIKQMINITAYGKVTAIEPMGNILVCNHEGGTETITEQGNMVGQTVSVDVTHPEELRFYVFKKENDGEPLNKYVPLGQKPPFIKIRFGLKSKFEWYPKTKSTLKNNNTEYKKYGGVSISSYFYTDTVPVWWSWKKSLSWVPPYDIAVEETHTSSDDGEGYNGSDGNVTTSTLRMEHFSGTYSLEGVESPDGKTNVDGAKNNWTASTLGCYNRFIYEQQKDNKFVFPFFVRYAYEMFDGSLMMHSYPVLMIPNSRGPIFALDGKWGLRADLDDNTETYEKVRIEFKGRTYGFASKLMHQITKLTDAEYKRLENWKDLIRGISIYITPPMYNYNQSGQVFGWHSMSNLDPANGGNDDPWDKFYTVGKVVKGDNWGTLVTNGEMKLGSAFMGINDNEIYMPYNNTHTAPAYCMTIPQKDDKDIIDMHEGAGQFFKLATIDFNDVLKYAKNGMTDGEVEIRNKALNTIAARELMQDDNNTHDTMSADILYGYNRRLNMAGAKRILHTPLSLETQWAHDYTSGRLYHEIIYANNDGEQAELHTTSNNIGVTWPKFIFYPGTDAREVLVVRDGSLKYRIKLKEHKFLNGMFWLADFTNKSDSIKDHLSTKAVEITTESKNVVVDESNKIFTSATDNPFYVPIGCVNIAGGGEIRALCSATQAMSQGQFGQHPMYCFTSEGVWALTVDTNGGWGTVQPMTRDVIGADSKPLSLDSTVIFLTERGLLQLAGATVEILSDVLSTTDTALDLNKFGALADAIDTKFGLVQVIPSQTEGEDPTIITTMPTYAHMRTKAVSFTDKHFPMGNANLGYDSDNQRIYVTPHGEGFSWVYNIKSKLWTQATTHLDKQVPSYPELISQQGSDVVLVSVDGGVVGNRYPDGLVVTRPIKFQDMGLLKKWREMILRGQFKNYTLTTPMVMTALWGTRDWNKFALVASSQGSRITRWGGSPYFGHVVLVALHGNNAYNIQVNGIDVDVEEEQINKLR